MTPPSVGAPARHLHRHRQEHHSAGRPPPLRFRTKVEVRNAWSSLSERPFRGPRGQASFLLLLGPFRGFARPHAGASPPEAQAERRNAIRACTVSFNFLDTFISYDWYGTGGDGHWVMAAQVGSPYKAKADVSDGHQARRHPAVLCSDAMVTTPSIHSNPSQIRKRRNGLIPSLVKKPEQGNSRSDRHHSHTTGSWCIPYTMRETRSVT
jgi:hypothetical protein